jgi:DNA-directed RNA polymerase specialized sigma24 family protein
MFSRRRKNKGRKRIHIPKKELERLYYDEGLTQAQIASRYGCSSTTIYKLMQEYDLKTRITADYYRVEIARETLQALYDEGLTQAQIAARLGCSKGAIANRMREYGIVTRTYADYYQVEIPRETLRALCDEGLTPAEIAGRLGCSKDVVHKRLKQYGLKARSGVRRHPNRPSCAELRELYETQGLNIYEIAASKGCSHSAVHKWLKMCGIPLRKRGAQHVTHVSPSVYARWTPALAYAVGLVAADGNLVRGYNTVEMASTDREILVHYHTCLQLGPEVRIRNQHIQGYKTLYVVRFADRGYRVFLERVGLTPAKSKTLGPLAIPRAIFADFCRGYWDGDGSFSVQRDNGRLRASVSCGSPVFLEWLQACIEEQTGLRGGISGVQMIFYNPKSIALGRWMYYAPDLPALRRKRAVWERFA